MTVSKATLQEFYSMTLKEKREFITFLRKELRQEAEKADHEKRQP